MNAKRVLHLSSFKEPEAVARQTAAPAHPFDVPATEIGVTTHFTVYSETALGARGQRVANEILSTCEADNDRMAAWFGIPALSFTVIALRYPGGAYHYGCRGAVLYCDIGSPANSDLTRMLVVAEAVEAYEAKQAKGWNCGWSSGEGLSRVLSTELYPQQLDGFASAASWLNSPRSDFVTKVKRSDTDYPSIGCSVLFLNWLHAQLGYSWDAIAQAGGGTLESTYFALTKQKNGFANFKALIDRHFPAGQTAHLKNDNPFPLS